MIEKNEVTHARRGLAADLLKLYFNDTILDEIDKIPFYRTPNKTSATRCCIYKDRAMYRYQLMALLGIDVETENNELMSIAQFVEQALERDAISSKVLTIIDIACASCQQNSFMVTNMCKGCAARPCEVNCPKDAIQILNGKSLIDQRKCISCGKCLKACPYNAIVFSPVPCERRCPVGAIGRNNDTGKQEIDYSKCIYCGRCTRACPFGTIMERSQILDVAKQIKKSDTPTIALIAPAIVGQFPGTVEQVIAGLKEVGFDYVYEVAIGADITAKNEAQELIDILNEGKSLLGTSCCPAYTESVIKHLKEFIPFVSHTKTPMAYTAEIAKEDHPEAKTVFIGPCIAKKFEGSQNDVVDFALTFEELGAFFEAKEIKLAELDEASYNTEEATLLARNFCVAGGVTETVKEYAKQIDPSVEINPLFINGLDKKGLKVLAKAAQGKLPNNLIECMSCEGGCIAGPGVMVPPSVSGRRLAALLKSTEK
jgi:[FeFe] hydrogenase (group B1/B3)